MSEDADVTIPAEYGNAGRAVQQGLYLRCSQPPRPWLRPLPVSPPTESSKTISTDATVGTCMPCSFGPPTLRRSGARAQIIDHQRVTVAVRWIPLVPVARGTRVARPARTTMVRTWRRRLPAHPVGEARPP
jgi:hypothetical protein